MNIMRYLIGILSIGLLVNSATPLCAMRRQREAQIGKETSKRLQEVQETGISVTPKVAPAPAPAPKVTFSKEVQEKLDEILKIDLQNVTRDNYDMSDHVVTNAIAFYVSLPVKSLQEFKAFIKEVDDAYTTAIFNAFGNDAAKKLEATYDDRTKQIKQWEKDIATTNNQAILDNIEKDVKEAQVNLDTVIHDITSDPITNTFLDLTKLDQESALKKGIAQVIQPFKTSYTELLEQINNKRTTLAPAKVKFSKEVQEKLDLLNQDLADMTRDNYELTDVVTDAKQFNHDHPGHFKNKKEIDAFIKEVDDTYTKATFKVFGNDKLNRIKPSLDDREKQIKKWETDITNTNNQATLGNIEKDVKEAKVNLDTMIHDITLDPITNTFLDLTKLDQESSLAKQLNDSLASYHMGYKTLLTKIADKLPKAPAKKATKEQIEQLIFYFSLSSDLGTLDANKQIAMASIDKNWENKVEVENQITTAYEARKKELAPKGPKEQTLNEAVDQLKKMQTMIKANPSEKERKTFQEMWNTYHKRGGKTNGISAEKFWGIPGMQSYEKAWNELKNLKGFTAMMQ